ncbi:hypothetical protein AHAS_Ahas09G0130600 [Arachis hypogaea]
MVTRERGHTRSQGKSRNERPANNYAEFMVAMVNLANTMEVNATATLQAVQRFTLWVFVVQLILRKRITSSKLWSVRCTHSMSRTTNTWSLPLISLRERPSTSGKPSATYQLATALQEVFS